VFWKTLLWSYGNLITWGIEAFAALVAALVAAVVMPQWSLHELKALNLLGRSIEAWLRQFFALFAHSHLLPNCERDHLSARGGPAAIAC
jgi:hypothetical protein